MKKSVKLSLVASAVLAGSLVLTGCGSSSSTTASTTGLEIQASVVNRIEAGGLTLSFADGTQCVNNVELNTSSKSHTLAASSFVVDGTTTACTKNLASDDFNATVNPLKSYAVATAGAPTAGASKLSTEIGTEPLKGAKGKKVNILSTIALATNQTVEDIDVNDVASPGVKALKDIIQTKLATGVSLATLVPTSAALNIASFKAEAVGKTTALTTTGIPAALTTSLGINLAAINAVKEVYKADATKTFAQAAADNNVTTQDSAITTLKSSADTAASAAKLSVSGIALKVGSYTYGGTSNNFKVTRTNDQTVTSSSDVIISVAAAGANSFGVTNGTLKAKVVKGNNTLTLTVTGVTISTDSDGKVSATIASGATVSVASTGSTGIDDVTGTTNKALTTTDLKFSLNTLIDAITSNASAVSTAKTQILNALSSKGDYTVTVGISGTMTSGAITNLADVSSALGTGFKGFTGTVSIVGSAAEVAGIAKATTDLATAEAKVIDAQTAVSSIATATTSTAVDTAVTAASTAKAAVDTACDAVTNNTYATSTQKATAASIKSTVASVALQVTTLASDRKAYITANATALANITAYNTLANTAVNGSNQESSTTLTINGKTYTLKAKTATATPASTGQNVSIFVVVNGGTAVAVPVSNVYAANTSFTIGLYSGSTVIAASQAHVLTSAEISATETSDVAISYTSAE